MLFGKYDITICLMVIGHMVKNMYVNTLMWIGGSE